MLSEKENNEMQSETSEMSNEIEKEKTIQIDHEKINKMLDGIKDFMTNKMKLQLDSHGEVRAFGNGFSLRYFEDNYNPEMVKGFNLDVYSDIDTNKQYQKIDRGRSLSFMYYNPETQSRRNKDITIEDSIHRIYMFPNQYSHDKYSGSEYICISESKKYNIDDTKRSIDRLSQHNMLENSDFGKTPQGVFDTLINNQQITLGDYMGNLIKTHGLTELYDYEVRLHMAEILKNSDMARLSDTKDDAEKEQLKQSIEWRDKFVDEMKKKIEDYKKNNDLV